MTTATSTLTGIGNPRIEEAFHRHLPPGSTLVPAPWSEYIAFAVKQPTIVAQIRAGIYKQTTIQRELLTVAWSWPETRTVAVCLDLIRWHMATVPLMFSFGYAQAVALHEAYHIEHHVGDAHSLEEQMERELECNEALEAHHPHIARLSERATRISPTISRVMDRAEDIGNRYA